MELSRASIRRYTDRIAILERRRRTTRRRRSGRAADPRPQQRPDEEQGGPRGDGQGRAPRREGGPARRSFVAWIDADPARKTKYGERPPAPSTRCSRRAGRRRVSATRLLGEMYGVMGSALGSAQTLYRLLRREAEEGRRPRPGVPGAQLDAVCGRGRSGLQRTLDPEGRPRAAAATPSLDSGGAPRRAADRAPRHGDRPCTRDERGRRRPERATPGSTRSTPGRRSPTRSSGCRSSTSRRPRSSRRRTRCSTLAAALYPMQEANRETDEGARRRDVRALGPRLREALLAKSGGLVAPDANSTLRVTFGTVKGVEPRDGMLLPPPDDAPGRSSRRRPASGEFNAPTGGARRHQGRSAAGKRPRTSTRS